jgi:heptosyltransferase-2
VGQRLRDRGYVQAIVLPRSLKSALLPFFARIPRRTGYRGESRYGLINDMRTLDRSLCPQTVQRFVALGQAAGEPVPPPIPSPRLIVEEEGRQRALKRLGLSVDAPVIGLVPGAQYGSSRRWPAERFGELAARLVAAGYAVWIFGSAADGDAARTIRGRCSGNLVDLTGRTELEEVVDLISLASVVVTNDTGLMHVAGAVGTRVVALYGATTPEHTPSLAENHRMIYRDIECSPCSARICPFGHNRCLTEIETGEVFEATRTLAQEPHILE